MNSVRCESEKARDLLSDLVFSSIPVGKLDMRATYVARLEMHVVVWYSILALAKAFNLLISRVLNFYYINAMTAAREMLKSCRSVRTPEPSLINCKGLP